MLSQNTLDSILTKNEMAPHEKPINLNETFTIFEVQP